MTRRFFQRTVSGAILAYLSPRWIDSSGMVKPARLRQGDTIALIAPGSALPVTKIEEAVLTCQKLGLRPFIGPNATEENGYLAGTDEQRLFDLHAAFADKQVNGIWCLRGGYGCTRLLPRVDYRLVRENPKVLIGYSDITALHHAFASHCNLVTFHGPVATSESSEYSLDYLRKAVMSAGPQYLESSPEASGETYVIREGSASGALTGGNLSLLAAMAGTPYLDRFAGKIVCIEDIGEKPYRIDRMLVQLFQATDLADAAGIILGQFNDCEPDPGDKSLSLKETLTHQFASFTGPVFYGFSFGHIKNQVTLPFGIQARFNTTDQRIELLESSTEA
ncbi:MAG: LD-carboxypeptidase [Saprospiraceae bacterium]|nr:LD-carboxypeptidase [Saprospiraceae bacterium]